VQLSVVIPCLNEIETIELVVRAARSALARAGLSGEVLVADNGSTDGSQAAASVAGARVVNISSKGYGSAVAGGIRAAQGACVIFADADCSYDFGELEKFWSRLQTGADMVVGTRFPRAGGVIDSGAMPWLHRWVGTPVMSAIGRILFGSRLSDYNCGMRAMTREAFDRLALQTSGMEFASEMIIKATLFGLRIAEVPIHFHKDARGRPPHLRTFRDGWRHLRFMLICSPRWLFVYPGLLLMVAGLLGFVALLPGPIHLGRVMVDTNTLLVCAMLLLMGHQIVSLGVVAKLFALQIGMHPPLPSRGLDALRLFFQLESWAGFGLVLFLLGLGVLSFGVLVWNRAGFGMLSYSESLRIVIPGVTLIMLGVQVIFTSFLISMVGRTYT
jgi:glycosyltransferase involved in cell wall biosynthesis